jgi:hypothetical protein
MEGVMDHQQRERGRAAPSCGDAVYGLGLVGALVWYWPRANGAGEHVAAVLKAIVWPAYLVYDAHKLLTAPRPAP